ncbi:MAG: hypothetical protein PHR56_01400 [Dehalococcoidales bacterium]|nr:hypothetical protein [Dehalococcoidales bacterium]
MTIKDSAGYNTLNAHIASNKVGKRLPFWRAVLKRFAEIFDDSWMKASGILLAFMLIFFVFNMVSGLPRQRPIIGVFTYFMVPVLFILGAINFIIIIVRSKEKDEG